MNYIPTILKHCGRSWVLKDGQKEMHITVESQKPRKVAIVYSPSRLVSFFFFFFSEQI